MLLTKTMHNCGHPTQWILSSSRKITKFFGLRLEEYFGEKYTFSIKPFTLHTAHTVKPYTSKANFCLNRLSGYRTIRSHSSLKITLMRPEKLLQVCVI